MCLKRLLHLQILGPVWAMGPVEIMQLGFLALHLRVEELQELDISDWEALSVLGDLEGWTDRQVRAPNPFPGPDPQPPYWPNTVCPGCG